MHSDRLRRRAFRWTRLGVAAAVSVSVSLMSSTVVSAAGAGPAAVSPNFEMDGSFGSGGSATFSSATIDASEDLVTGADGKLVIVTSADDVLRLAPDGHLDPTFAGGGRLALPGAAALAMAPDGAILVAGYGGSSPTSKWVARIASDGTLDTALGTHGLVAVPDWVDTFAVDGSGRILVAGAGLVPPTNQPMVLMERFTPSLTLDTTFGTGGAEGAVVSAGGPALTATPSKIAVAPDGRIVVAGSVADTPAAGDTSVLVARFLANGALDPAWGSGGIAIGGIPHASPSVDKASDVSLIPDGGVVLAGFRTPSASSGQAGQAAAFLARYDPSGHLDPTFGLSAGGSAPGATAPAPRAVFVVGRTDITNGHTLLPDGHGGWLLLVNTYPTPHRPASNSAYAGGLIRFDPSGGPDPAFDNLGVFPIDPPANTSLSTVAAAATADGAIVVASTTSPIPPPGSPPSAWLPRSVHVARVISAPHRKGYWMLAGDGSMWGFGDAQLHGVPGKPWANAPWVHVEPTPTGAGYWVLAADGSVDAFGNALDIGNTAGVIPRLSGGETAASLSATPSGGGYCVFTNRGRVVPMGDATPYGDMSATPLNQPVVDSVATPDGRGYYMVAADGGIFSFGDATFYGSMGGKHLNAPVEALVPTADGKGYWLVASDGGIFAFGDAAFRGSMGATHLNKPVTGMVRFGDGYLMVGSDGGIFDFSDLPFFGSLGAHPPAAPVIAVAAIDT